VSHSAIIAIFGLLTCGVFAGVAISNVAAALLAAERTDQLDLIGAIVLAHEGRAALSDRDPLPLPACQVHPLHGPALRRPPRGRLPRASLGRPSRLLRKPAALCAGCRGCSAYERDQRALLADGVPYYRTEGFWARVGFGALDPDLPAGHGGHEARPVPRGRSGPKRVGRDRLRRLRRRSRRPDTPR
jgi:hypothetical protein